MKQRAMRVAEELKKIVMQILLEDLSDPRLGFVTITTIEVTDDLRFARIYYSVLGDEDAKEATAEALEEQHGYIRRLIVERINMKFAMDIRFEVDKAIDQSFKIDAIIKKIKDQEPPPAAEGSRG
jgi:ribosome-binding factor A